MFLHTKYTVRIRCTMNGAQYVFPLLSLYTPPIQHNRTKDIFASVGADGSVRMFDLRSLEHSTIIYETHDLTPLMRLSWNKQDPNYLATILTDSAKTVILDIRCCLPSLVLAFIFHRATDNHNPLSTHKPCIPVYFIFTP